MGPVDEKEAEEEERALPGAALGNLPGKGCESLLSVPLCVCYEDPGHGELRVTEKRVSSFLCLGRWPSHLNYSLI